MTVNFQLEVSSEEESSVSSLSKQAVEIKSQKILIDEQKRKPDTKQKQTETIHITKKTTTTVVSKV